MQMKEVVPFLAVSDMQKSVAFYVDGLGFQLKKKWVVGDELRWCRFSENRGEGVMLCFFPDSALEFYRIVQARGVGGSEPIVNNGMWATELEDPDAYQLLFESPTGVPEGTKLSEVA